MAKKRKPTIGQKIARRLNGFAKKLNSGKPVKAKRVRIGRVTITWHEPVRIRDAKRRWKGE